MTAQTSLQLRTLVKEDGRLEMSLASVPVPTPGPDEVVLQVQGSPINPSDIGLLFGAADMSAATVAGAGADAKVTAMISPAGMRAMAGRVGESLAAGNEGAGVVIAAGGSPRAQALVGKTVAGFGGAMYAQHRVLKAAECLVLPPGATAVDGASCFVNPLTALGMTNTMRLEGHSALVHTAAASNLGQMLNKICVADGIGLVNIVRSPEQAAILKAIGAMHIVDSSAPTFLDDLTAALVATGATLAFDAIGGGRLAGQILGCMETAANKTAKVYSRYGSNTHKQVYIYGGLSLAPTELVRSLGMAWGLGGWLLMPHLARIGPAEAQKMRERVAAELKTTFASHYSHVISLSDALRLEHIAGYNRRATGEKYLIDPSLG